MINNKTKEDNEDKLIFKRRNDEFEEDTGYLSDVILATRDKLFVQALSVILSLSRQKRDGS